MTALLLLALSAQQLYERAAASFRENRLEPARQALEEALRADPDHVPSLTLRARLALAAGDFDTAGQCVERAAALQPKSPSVRFLLGFARYLENDFEKALPALETARRLDPADPRAALYLAMTNEGLGRAEAAIALYEETLRLEERRGNPQPDAAIAYARLLFTLGRFRESADLVDRALKLDLHSRDARYEMGRLLYEKGEYAAAAEQGEKALALADPGTTDRQIHYLLGRCYLRLGDRARAEEHLAKFRASPPSLRR